MSRCKAPSLALTKALANYAQGHHQWRPTFSLGEELCPVCGAKAYCPECTSRFPEPKIHVVFCALHQGREQEEKEESKA